MLFKLLFFLLASSLWARTDTLDYQFGTENEQLFVYKNHPYQLPNFRIKFEIGASTYDFLSIGDDRGFTFLRQANLSFYTQDLFGFEGSAGTDHFGALFHWNVLEKSSFETHEFILGTRKVGPYSYRSYQATFGAKARSSLYASAGYEQINTGPEYYRRKLHLIQAGVHYRSVSHFEANTSLHQRIKRYHSATTSLYILFNPTGKVYLDREEDSYYDISKPYDRVSSWGMKIKRTHFYSKLTPHLGWGTDWEIGAIEIYDNTLIESLYGRISLNFWIGV